MAEVAKFGTMYFNGKPQDFNLMYMDNGLALGDTVPGKEIPWVKIDDGLYIAQYRICTNMSWDQLNEMGLVSGKPAHIDGRSCIVRCPRTETANGFYNEWNHALCVAGDDPRFWDTHGTFFWGQEISELDPDYRVTLGGSDIHGIHSSHSSVANALVGFRPVLEFFTPLPSDFKPLVGAVIAPMGPDCQTIVGKLVSYSDYDLVLEQHSPSWPKGNWVTPDENRVIIDRASVRALREV